MGMPGNANASGGFGGGQGGSRFDVGGGEPFVTSIVPIVVDEDGQVAQGFGDGTATTWSGGAQMEGGLASVDLEIPERGTAFYFQATRGDLELTVQPVRDSSTKGIAIVLACLLGLAVVWVATRRRNS